MILLTLAACLLCALHCGDCFSYIILVNHHGDLCNTTCLETNYYDCYFTDQEDRTQIGQTLPMFIQLLSHRANI